jgi:geranylgeranyl reductase family protein
MKSIAVIGAGPAGSQAAYYLARYGYKVDVYEEHPVIGKPVQCTGIISKNLKKLVPLDRFVVNQIKGAVFYSKHQKLELKTDRVQAYVVDRAKMDHFFAERARKQGANFHLNHRFMGGVKIKNKFILRFYHGTKLITKQADILIGADGPLSRVAKQAGLANHREFLYGIQARVRGEFDKDNVQMYLGSICHDFFAWIVPESEKYARIGLASKKNSRMMFDKFISKFDYQIIGKQAGLIPIFRKTKLQKNNIYLVGDAALQVKATTGGGVMMSLLAAKALARSIRTGIPYSLLLKKINYNLSLTKLIRDKLNRLQDTDYDYLLKLMGQNLDLLRKKGDMDFPARLAFSLLLKEPQLVKYLFQNPQNQH